MAVRIWILSRRVRERFSKRIASSVSSGELKICIVQPSRLPFTIFEARSYIHNLTLSLRNAALGVIEDFLPESKLLRCALQKLVVSKPAQSLFQ
jgi:hypothetical protein